MKRNVITWKLVPVVMGSSYLLNQVTFGAGFPVARHKRTASLPSASMYAPDHVKIEAANPSPFCFNPQVFSSKAATPVTNSKFIVKSIVIHSDSLRSLWICWDFFLGLQFGKNILSTDFNCRVFQRTLWGFFSFVEDIWGILTHTESISRFPGNGCNR